MKPNKDPGVSDPTTTRQRASGQRRRALVWTTLMVASALVITFSLTGRHPAQRPNGQHSHLLSIVSAENFWGNIAKSIGGRFVEVQSVINNPNVDPHSYEPTAADARAFAGANIAVVNGVGYDPWATRLLAADTVKHVINVGTVLGLPSDANPHRWYNPGDVTIVVNQLVTVLSSLMPSERRYFTDQAVRFSSQSLATFHQTLASISRSFSGVPIGASESIIVMLVPSLNLRLITPPDFLRAISEGGDVSPNDIATINRQIATREIWVYVYNRQNATPDIERQLELCRSHHIPVVSITETMQPATTTFARWQTSQLERLYSALSIAKAQHTHG